MLRNDCGRFSALCIGEASFVSVNLQAVAGRCCVLWARKNLTLIGECSLVDTCRILWTIAISHFFKDDLQRRQSGYPGFFAMASLDERMLSAIAECAAGSSVYAAAKKFEVAERTLMRRVKGFPRSSHGGHNRLLSVNEEKLLVDLLLKTAELGIPFDKPGLKRMVNAFCEKKGATGFTKDWHRRFLKRHKNVLSRRITHCTNRKKASEWNHATCLEWIQKLELLRASGYLDDPFGIWNLDESPFSVAEYNRYVYAKRGVKDVVSYADGDNHENITVLACGNAAGVMLRPLILYDGQVHLASRFANTDDKCWLAVNRSGYMDNALFTDYVQKELIPRLTAAKNVIFVDGHASHTSNLPFIEACLACGKDVRIMCLPAGQTSKLQPLDSRVFGPVRKYWRDILRERCSLTDETNFAAILMEKWDSFGFVHNLPSGFAATGIYPFSPEVISATVTPVKCVREPPKFHELYKDELLGLRAALARFHSLSAADLEETVKFVTVRCEGQADRAVDFAEILLENVMTSRPPKQKRPKDRRIDSKSGLCMTDSDVRDAIAEADRKKAEKAKQRKRKASQAKTKQPKKAKEALPDGSEASE